MIEDRQTPEIPKRRVEDRPPRRQRKGMYILPSLFTTANIAAGYYAILQATHGSVIEPWHFDFAAKAIGFAVLFDGLDGFIARTTHTSSDFRRGSGAVGVDVGISPVAGPLGIISRNRALGSTGCDCEFLVFDRGCESVGTF
jgi:CDP-alcohol phosphatidyltransferase